MGVDKTFDFLFSRKCPKAPIFGVKKFIISLFLVRFHFFWIHMKDLLILHDTKEKKIKKVLYTTAQSSFFSSFCGIWQPLSNLNGYNSKSIEIRKISKVIASCYLRPLQNEKEKKRSEQNCGAPC